MACHHIMVTRRMSVIVVTVTAEDRVFVGHLGAQRQLIRDENIRHIGADRAKWSTNFRGASGLGSHIS